MRQDPEGFDFAMLDEIPDPVGVSSHDASSSDASSDPAVDAKREASREKLLAREAQGSASQTRSDVRQRRMMALGVSAAWLVGLLVLVKMLRDVGAAPLAFAGQVALPALLGSLALYAAVAPGRLGLGPRVTSLIALTLAAPLAFALMALLSSTSSGLDDTALARHSSGCWAVGLLMAAIPTLAAAYALRRSNVTSVPWRSALVGSGVGLISAAVLGLHCSRTDAAHLLLAHVLPIAVIATAALLVVRRYARAD